MSKKRSRYRQSLKADTSRNRDPHPGICRLAAELKGHFNLQRLLGLCDCSIDPTTDVGPTWLPLAHKAAVRIVHPGLFMEFHFSHAQESTSSTPRSPHDLLHDERFERYARWIESVETRDRIAQDIKFQLNVTENAIIASQTASKYTMTQAALHLLGTHPDFSGLQPLFRYLLAVDVSKRQSPERSSLQGLARQFLPDAAIEYLRFRRAYDNSALADFIPLAFSVRAERVYRRYFGLPEVNSDGLERG